MEDKYEKFKRITGYDIKSFFEEYVRFCNQDYPNIISYYNGGDLVAESFYKLLILDKELGVIEPLFVLHDNTLDDISMWEILDNFTEVQTKIATIKSSERWLRSTNVKGSNSIRVVKTLRMGESFEDVSRQLNDDNPEDDWMKITIPQYIKEEDYTFEDGSRNTFYVDLKNSGGTMVDTVVDTLVGENILGRDISTEFIYVNNDLKIIKGNEAMEQALEIILNALKGCIPEFVDYGIANEAIGTTVNAIQYPTIFKSIMNMFQRDSRWSSVELLDVYVKEDSVFLKIKAETVMKTNYITSIPIKNK